MRLRTPEGAGPWHLVVPASAGAYRVQWEGGSRGPFAPHWTERVHGPALASGMEVELLAEPAADAFGGFLPAIDAAPRGFWQGVSWREAGEADFVGRPGLRWSAGSLRIHGRLIDGDGRALDGLDPRLELRVDGREARAVAAECWELQRGAPPMWGTGAEELRLELGFEGRRAASRTLRLARCELEVRGERLLANGEPFRVQGLLHWGYYPQLAGPDPEPDDLRAELRAMRARGFNLLKACLWLPPHRFLDVCDEEGMAVWVEYPLWNRPLGGEGVSREEALARYREFVLHDAAHPCVVLRTLTCENDRVDPELARELLALIEELAPGGLANDNSAWIDCNHDPAFWDEHPYLHAAQWPFWLERTRRVLERRPALPLILGETMAFDSLADERSRRAAVRLRRRQVEELRQVFPDAGYVICAARDIAQSPLGLQDEGGAWKTGEEEWAWQRRSLRDGPSALAATDAATLVERACAGHPFLDEDLSGAVTLAPSLDAPTLAALRGGATLLHLATTRAGAWRSPEHTFWSPVASFDAVEAEPELTSILEQELFEELLAGRALVPPPVGCARVLAQARDVHDRSGDDRLQPFVLAARVGGGRLLVSSLRADNDVGRRFHRALAERFLVAGDAWLAGLAALELPSLPRCLFLDGPWDLRGQGVRGGRQRLRPGTLLEARGLNAVQGWVEAEARVTLPADWEGPAVLRAEALGDGWELYLDDQRVHVHGRPGFTWDAGRDVPATVDLSQHLRPGESLRWRIRTKDHRGAGVLIGPLYLCAGDPEQGLTYGT